MTVSNLLVVLACLVSGWGVLATIDVNIHELQYLSNHLDPFECRRLIAALHYTTYDLPNNLAAAERKVDEEIPCLEHLLHWNVSPSEGKGGTHEAIVHRLRQLNRNDLADWLGKTAFRQIARDLGTAMSRPFGELGDQETETSYPLMIEPLEEPEEADPWLQIDTILMAILLGLLGTFLTLIGAIIHYKIKSHLRKVRRKADEEDELLRQREQRIEESETSSNSERNTTMETTDETEFTKT